MLSSLAFWSDEFKEFPLISPKGDMSHLIGTVDNLAKGDHVTRTVKEKLRMQLANAACCRCPAESSLGLEFNAFVSSKQHKRHCWRILKE